MISWCALTPVRDLMRSGVTSLRWDETKSMRRRALSGRLTRPRSSGIWYHIIESQIETVMPYMLYKDVCNRKSNESNFGSIKCSNLCAEIMEYSAPDEVAVCNLASIAVNMFVNQAWQNLQLCQATNWLPEGRIEMSLNISFHHKVRSKTPILFILLIQVFFNDSWIFSNNWLFFNIF